MKATKATIVNSWKQVDGGARYEVRVVDKKKSYTVTVDRVNGKLSGWVRDSCPNEDTVLRAAFDAVR